MQLTDEVREQMVLKLATISTELGWDPSITLLIACDLVKALTTLEMNNLDPEHREILNSNKQRMLDFVKQRVDGYMADTITKVVTLSDVLSQLIIKLAKENIQNGLVSR